MKTRMSLLFISLLLILLPQSYNAESLGSSVNESDSTESLVQRAIEEGERANVLFYNQVDYEVLNTYGAEIINEYEAIQAVTIKISTDLLNELEQEESVKSVEVDQLVQVEGQTTNWGYDRLNIANRVPTSLTGEGVKIAIVDSGVDTSHPDLKVAGGTCVLDIVDDPFGCYNSYEDDNGHGTHIAGIIAAQDNDIGVLGIAPDASIYAVKALDSLGYGTTSSIMSALDWSIKNEMDIVNLSLTTSNNDLALKEMVKKAYRSGILVIAAAGNKGNATGLENNVLYPAKYDEVIAVSALGKDNKLIATSSVGNEIEFTAPGGLIYSTLPLEHDSYGARDGYGSMSGTSMASPFVTAMSALYMEKYPTYTNEQIRELLQNNALDLGEAGKDTRFGYGLVQIDKTVLPTPVVSTTTSDRGTITINIEELPEGSTGYNLYRFNRLIVSNSNDSTIEDYASKGTVSYKIVPVINGMEQVNRVTKFTVTLSTPNISDMNNSYWFSRNVMYLYSKKVMNGYASGEMKPYQQITRAEALVMLVNSLGLKPDVSYNTFRDVPNSSFAAGHIGIALKEGIITGFTDGTFRGNQAVTRAEMSIMIANAYKLQAPSQTVTFSDLNSKVTGYQAIQKVAANKIAQGYTDGTFRPYDKMDRATYAVFISRAMNESLR